LRPYYIVLSYQAFKKYFQEFKEGDLIGIRLPLKKEELGLIIDLIHRKVEAFPSFLSQILSVSKTLQAEILKNFMLPYTFSVRDKNSLLFAISELSKLSKKFYKFVTKDDRANCGLGVRLWNSLEEIYNVAGTPVLPFPFVLQPFYENVKDIRVIILGEYYMEAYERINPYNFRKNLFLGGKAKSYQLNEKEIEFCKKVMERGNFPYAHLDLIYTGEEGPYLSEISLKGGIKGAKISPQTYEETVKKIHEEFYKIWEEKYGPVKYLTP
jgi:ribosomal protein S6--L-glutamate ligase